MNAQNVRDHPLVTCALATIAAPSENGGVITRRQVLLAGATLFLSLSACPQVAHNAKAAPPPDARVDINHATVGELLTLPGMTPTWAGRIVRFRPYHAKNDLLTRGVVSGPVYDRIKDYVIAHREKE